MLANMDHPRALIAVLDDEPQFGKALGCKTSKDKSQTKKFRCLMLWLGHFRYCVER